jgi:hypothetical protein
MIWHHALAHGRRLTARLRKSRIVRDTAGTSFLEFALIMPVLIGMGMYGTEIANMSITRMQVSQLAISVADTASRLQQNDNSPIPPTVTEDDVDSVMMGADEQGRSINLAERGRVILSSLEEDPITRRQFIHWQRCTGGKLVNSRYGNEGSLNGLAGAVLAGMGTGATRITAPPGSAVMFAEVHYDYQGIFGELFVEDVLFIQEAAFIVRDARDLRAANLSGLTGGGSDSGC